MSTFRTEVTLDPQNLCETFTFEGSIARRELECLKLSAYERGLLNSGATSPEEALSILATIYRRLADRAAS